jgi:very-short-patch-repair endonuclease/predicted transcriptional regulator of viral defense system
MRLVDRNVAQVAAEQWGVLSRRELADCGLSDDAIAVRVKSGRLHRIHHGVYAVGHRSLALEGRFLAAAKACGPGAVLSHFSAGALWAFVHWEDRHIEVTIADTTPRAHAGVRVHRTATLEPRDVTRHRGIPVTSPVRTLLDLASLLDYEALRRAARQAQSQQRVNLVQLAEALQRTGRRRGVATLRRIAATGPAPTRSELEDVVLDLILRGGFEHPVVNQPLILDGRRVIPDFRWPEEQLVVEADGAAWHANALAREDDAERQALLESRGERVLRVTWAQAVVRPSETLERLKAAGAPRSGRPRPR